MAKNVVFKPADENVETQICYLAASEGLKSAKSFMRKQSISFGGFTRAVSCNGLSLSRFADKYQKIASGEAKLKTDATIVLVANNSESMVCIDALTIGEKQAREKHKAGNSGILCNDKNIKSFMRQYKSQNFVVRNSAN